MSKYKYLFLTLAASIILGWFYALLLLNHKQIEVADKEAHWRAEYLELVNFIGQFTKAEERGLTLEEQVDGHLDIARRNLELHRYNEARAGYDDADRILSESYERTEFSTYLKEFRIRLNKIDCMRDFGFPQYIDSYVRQANIAIAAMEGASSLKDLSPQERSKRQSTLALCRFQLANELALLDFLEVNRGKVEEVRRNGFEKLLARYESLQGEIEKTLLAPTGGPEEKALRLLLQDVRTNKNLVQADLTGESLFFPEAS